MDTHILTQELTSLVQESRRKYGDVKIFADKALVEVKALPPNPTPQDIANLPSLTRTFILACKSQNVKLIRPAMVCIQRLAMIGGLPRDLIAGVVDGLHISTSVTPVQDVQLKILQTLPSLMQNYSTQICGDPLFNILTAASVLLNSKLHAVVSTATATIQQLISSAYDLLKAEDGSQHTEDEPLVEVQLGGEKILIRPCAHDAFWIFTEVCLMASESGPRHIPLSPFPQSTIFDVIESILSNSRDVFRAHKEQVFILQTVLMPFVTSSLADKLKFSSAVRHTRLLRLMVHNYLDLALDDCETALSLMNHLIDTETANSWRRILSLELFSGIYANEEVLLSLYRLYDKDPDRKPIIKDNLSLFVRVASERPALIGLGPNPSFPIPPSGSRDMVDQGALGPDNGSGAGGQGSIDAIGISSQWSTIRTPCIEQLDKLIPLQIPDTYVYTLVLTSINFIAEGLADIVLPASGLSEDRRKKKRHVSQRSTSRGDSDTPTGDKIVTNEQNHSNYPTKSIPTNPLELTDHPSHHRILIASEIIDQAWPAVLATCSTFLYSALDADIFRQLVRSIQKLTQSSGLLRMSAPRDAFLSFLSKAAVPTQAIPTLRNYQTSQPSNEVVPGPGSAASRVLLTVESLVSTSSRRVSVSSESQRQAQYLNIRNLLCMRALVNLAIALGPTLGSSWSIVLENVRYIDLLAIPTSRPATQGSVSSKDGPDFSELSMSSINNELFALGTALNRLCQGTADLPNESFRDVLSSICRLLSLRDVPRSRRPSVLQNAQDNTLSLSTAHSSTPEFHEPECINTLKRLKTICLFNLQRFGMADANESGWNSVTGHLESMFPDRQLPREIRIMSAAIVTELCHDLLTSPALGELGKNEEVQRRSITTLVSRYKEPYVVALDDVETDGQTSVFQTLHSIIEHSGDYLGSVWPLIFNMIRTSFKERAPATYHDGLVVDLVSVQIARTSFNAVELICSDYLNALPRECLIALVNILFQFCAQTNDMNMALTAAAHYWNLSDYLLQSVEPGMFDKLVSKFSSLDSLEATSGVPVDGDPEQLIPYTWIVLLMRLTIVVQDTRAELRDSALQILLRIFQNYGPRLSPEGWNFCCRQVLVQMLSNNVTRQATGYPPTDGDCESEEVQSHIETTRLMLTGVGDLLSTNMDLILKSSGFSSIWKSLVEVLNRFLDVKCHGINSAVYSTVTSLLTSTHGSEISTELIDILKDIWIKQFPLQVPSQSSGSNHEPFENYVKAFTPLYRHCSARLDDKEIDRMINNLVRCIRDSDSRMYASDYDKHIPVQNLVMESIEIIDASTAQVAVIVLKRLTELMDLQLSPPKDRRLTFIAIAKTAIDQVSRIYLQSLERDGALVETGVLNDILKSLHSAIRTKARIDQRSRTEPLWQKATTAVIKIIRQSLGSSECSILMAKNSSVTVDVWTWIGWICDAIASGDTLSTTKDQAKYEAFDVEHLGLILDLISRNGESRLGAGLVSDQTLQQFAATLLKNSIFHPIDEQHLPRSVLEYSSYSSSSSGGQDKGKWDVEAVVEYIGNKRHFGKTYDQTRTTRFSIAVRCLEELFTIVSVSSQPQLGKSQSDSAFPQAASRVRTQRLAELVLPFVVLRSALPLQAYITDQPLRGQLPHPSSVRDELMTVLRLMFKTECLDGILDRGKNVKQEQGAKVNAGNVGTDDSDRLTPVSSADTHLFLLYPVLCDAAKVSRSDPDGSIVEQLDVCLDRLGRAIPSLLMK